MSQALDIGLSCRPRKEGNSLVFDYELHNRSRTAVYAADAMRVVDGEPPLARADAQAVSIILREDMDAVVGKFLPPVPPHWRMVVPAVPLAVAVEPGATVARSLSVRLPLAETSPLVDDLSIRDYDMLDIQAVVLAIGYWAADTPGLDVAAARFSPEHMQLAMADPRNGARMVWQRYPVRGLMLFRRNDAFPRTV